MKRRCEMSKVHDITGQKFNRLTVIGRAENNKYNRAQWKCKCDCGNTIIVSGNALLRENTKSCGCLNYDKLKESKNKTHGMSNTRIFRIWINMKARCINEKHEAYKDYGGRGICVCEEWKNSFEAFYDWSIKNGYSDKLTIDRIDVNGNYEPSNCRWITLKEQQNNKRTNHIITYNGESHTIAQWGEKVGINRKILARRINKGWEVERALTTPVRERRSSKEGE